MHKPCPDMLWARYESCPWGYTFSKGSLLYLNGTY